MTEDLDAANHYLVRAEECRAIAHGMTDSRTRQSLMNVAHDYVQMSETRRNMHAISEMLKRGRAET